MGPDPIGWADMAAWAALTSTALSPFEARTILAIDHAWLEAQATSRPATPPPAPAAPRTRSRL
jgi:hypothetical protein